MGTFAGATAAASCDCLRALRRPQYAQTCLRWLSDWIIRNPRGWGIHWTSALEHAIRIFAWAYTLCLVRNVVPEPEAARYLGALLQHAEFVERHLSPGSSANNHLIGEAAALAFLGSLLPDSPLRVAGSKRATAF